MAGKRKQYTAEFKFKVVLESLQRDTTQEEVCRKYSVSSSMLSRWRQALHEIGPEIFRDQRDPPSRSKAQGYDTGESLDNLKQLIGELTVQNDILKKSERHCWANERAAQNGGGAHAVCAPRSPINKSPLARVVGIARSSLYLQLKRPKQDKALAVRIEAAHEKDDTMGHRKLAALLGTGKNRNRRVMHKYGIAARRKRKKYVYP